MGGQRGGKQGKKGRPGTILPLTPGRECAVLEQSALPLSERLCDGSAWTKYPGFSDFTSLLLRMLLRLNFLSLKQRDKTF